MGSQQEFADMLRFVSEHKITPHIDRKFSLEQAPQALAYLDSGKQTGKVVLDIQNN